MYRVRVRDDVMKLFDKYYNYESDVSIIFEYILNDYKTIKNKYGVSDDHNRIDDILWYTMDDILDVRSNYYNYNNIIRFIDDVIDIGNTLGPSYILGINMLILKHMTFKIDDLDNIKHINNKISEWILNNKDQFISFIPSDDYLMRLWYKLSSLGYVKISERLHRVTSLKHNVFLAAFNLNVRGNDCANVNLYNTDIGKQAKLLRYRSGVRVEPLDDAVNIDIYNTPSVSAYNLIEYINCSDCGIKGTYPLCGINKYFTAINKHISTSYQQTAIAGMHSTADDLMAIGAIQSTYLAYYELLQSILDSDNYETKFETYQSLRRLLVISTQLFNRTKSCDIYWICNLIIMIIVSLYKYENNVNRDILSNLLPNISKDNINYMNSSGELIWVCELLTKSLDYYHMENTDTHDSEHGFHMSSDDICESVMEETLLMSTDTEINLSLSLFEHLTEGFEDIGCANEGDKNDVLCISGDNDSMAILVFDSRDDSEFVSQCDDMVRVMKDACDNRDFHSISANMAIMKETVNLLNTECTNLDIRHDCVSMLRVSMSDGLKLMSRYRKYENTKINPILTKDGLFVKLI